MDADSIRLEIEKLFTDWERREVTQKDIDRLVDSMKSNIISWAQTNADDIKVEVIPEEKRIEITFTADLSGLVDMSGDKL